MGGDLPKRVRQKWSNRRRWEEGKVTRYGGSEKVKEERKEKEEKEEGGDEGRETGI